MERKKLDKKVDMARRLQTRTILTEELAESFAGYIRRGLPADAVCNYLGIDGPTFHTWHSKGKAFLIGNYEPEEHFIFGYFVRQYERALAEYRLGLGDRLHQDEDWFRCLKILERRDRRNFGHKEPPGGATEQVDPLDIFL